MTAPTPAPWETDCLRCDPWDGGKGDDPYRLLDDRIVTARKAHECIVCFGEVAAGSRSRARKELSPDHGCKTFRFCAECCAAQAAWVRGHERPLLTRTGLGMERCEARRNGGGAP